MKRRTLIQTSLIMAVLLLLTANLIQAQQSDTNDFQSLGAESAIGTAFTYQGQLVYNDAPVNDTCDFTFSLWDEAGSGAPPTGGNQINSDVTLTDLTVSDGLFTASLDFGTDSFNGHARWLEIEVNCGGGATTLAPRQELTPAPYALYAPPNHSLIAADGDPVDAVYVNNDGNVGIGTTSPTERLTVAGSVESTSGGFKFPDGTIQTTAAGSSSSNVKELVQDFVVASGESVTTGDVVQFLDGYVSRASDGIGSELAFSAAYTTYSAFAPLSSTQFVVVFHDSNNSNYGTAMIGTISGNTITYSSKFVLNPAATYEISVATLSPAKFVVTYRDGDNSYYGTAVIGDISGNTITFSSEYVFNPASNYPISTTALSSTKFVVAYRDFGNSSYGTAVIGDVSGNTIAYGPEYVFNTAPTDNISVAALSSTRFVVAYRHNDEGKAVIGDISGTSITFGSEYVYSEPTRNISVASLSATQFVVAYADSDLAWYGTAVVGDVSGTTITYGKEYIFNAAQTNSISVSPLSSTQFVVAYADLVTNDYASWVIGDISGNTITYGSTPVFNSANTYGITTARLSSTQFVVGYRDGGNYDYGTAVIGNVTGSTVGIAGESQSEGQSVPVIIGGVSDIHSGLTPGDIYFSDASGGLTTFATTRRIGLALSNSELLLDIDVYK